MSRLEIQMEVMLWDIVMGCFSMDMELKDEMKTFELFEIKRKREKRENPPK
jgi:hypothetical protein